MAARVIMLSFCIGYDGRVVVTFKFMSRVEEKGYLMI